jgi:hypothetical protein
MILRIFIAVLLFEIVSAPIICAVVDCSIRCWYKHRMKYLSDLLIFAGEQLKKTEGSKQHDQSGNV